jgi:hypothetical protein
VKVPTWVLHFHVKVHAVRGHDGIDQFVAGAQQQWHLGTPGAEPVAIGFDVVELDGGTSAEVHGFLHELPG